VPQKDEPLDAPGAPVAVLQFFKDHRCRVVTYADMHRLEQMPKSVWWVITFAMSPTINAINVTFVIL
jgi:hypothetical protein